MTVIEKDKQMAL